MCIGIKREWCPPSLSSLLCSSLKKRVSVFFRVIYNINPQNKNVHSSIVSQKKCPLIYHNISKSFFKLCPKGNCRFPLGDKRLWHSQIIQHIICHRYKTCSFKAVFRSTLVSMQCLGKYIPPIAKCCIVLLLTQCCFCAHVKALAPAYVTLFIIKKNVSDD